MTTDTTPNTSTGNAASLPPSPIAPASNGKRKRALLILLVVVLIAGGAWLAWYLTVARWHQSTDDAYVQGNIVSITPQTPGTVVAINAEDGMRVEAGQVLVQLDPNDAQVAYAQAEANLANTVRQVRGLYSSVDAAQADIAARQVAVAQALARKLRAITGRPTVTAAAALSSANRTAPRHAATSLLHLCKEKAMQ